jgi:hypothetical protein
MHVDDFLEMANDLGYLKDDSDLNEKTFMNVMYSIECTLKDPKYKIRDPLEWLQEAAFRYSLRNDGVLKDVWDNNEYSTFLEYQKKGIKEASITDLEEDGLVLTRSLNQIRTPIKKSFNMEGWKRIPSMADLAVVLDEYNVELARIGFQKRLPTTLEFIGTKNAAMSAYMIHCLKRLNGKLEAKDTKGYWKICLHLMRNSISFRTAAIIKVLPNWWHAISLEQVSRIVRRVDEIISIWDTNLLYMRQYLHEPTKIRPLGIPAPEWRIVMHMFNNFLVQFLKAEVVSWNHGFIPGKGTISAIKDLIHREKKFDFIYEFDFKQFFPRVYANSLTTLLLYRGVPEEICWWLEDINGKLPIFPKEIELESDKEIAATRGRLDHYGKIWIDEGSSKRKVVADTYFPGNIVGKTKIDLIGMDAWTELTEWDGLESSSGYGLPQGLNTSPILSIFSIIDWIKGLKKRKIDPLMFADDGHLLSNKRFKPLPPEGHEFHESKSKWVKETFYGETFKMSKYRVIKFLGVDIDFENDTISGNTRKGKKLKFSIEAENLSELLKQLYIDKYGYSKSKLENISSSGMWGFILSKLYCGSWEKLTYEDKKWRQHKDSWWVKQNGGKKFNVKKRDRIRHRGLSSIAVNVLIEIIQESKNRVNSSKYEE